MVNGASGNPPPAMLDVERAAPPTTSGKTKSTMVAGCAALATGLAALGGLLLAGGAGRVGPFAVKHDYQTNWGYNPGTLDLTQQNTVDQSSSSNAAVVATLGALSLAASIALGGFAVKMAKS